MWSILYALLILKVASCADDPKLVTRTFDVGDTVTLKCPRQNEVLDQAMLYWIRFSGFSGDSGNLPEFLGATFTFDYEGVNKTPHFTTKQGQETFDLQISASKLNDTGFYYCVKVQQLNMEFVSVTFLEIKDPESDVSVFSPVFSDTVDSGHSVDLQCWLQTHSLQCFEDHMVLWFKPGLDQSSPGLVYSQRNSPGQCDRSLEDHGPHKCLYTFSKNMSPSDAGTYHCAVAACGQIHFGNAVNVIVNKETKCDLERARVALIVLSTIFGLNSIVFAIYLIKRKLNWATKSCGQHRLQVLKRKADCEAAARRTIKAAQSESVYTYVTFVYVKE